MTGGQLLRHTRLQRGETQAYVSAVTGIDVGVLSRIENGKREVRTYHANLLSAWCGLPATAFLVGGASSVPSCSAVGGEDI
jgi:transcriptional regulator with XRE-family HTH domain